MVTPKLVFINAVIFVEFACMQSKMSLYILTFTIYKFVFSIFLFGRIQLGKPTFLSSRRNQVLDESISVFLNLFYLAAPLVNITIWWHPYHYLTAPLCTAPLRLRTTDLYFLETYKCTPISSTIVFIFRGFTSRDPPIHFQSWRSRRNWERFGCRRWRTARSGFAISASGNRVSLVPQPVQGSSPSPQTSSHYEFPLAQVDENSVRYLFQLKHFWTFCLIFISTS